MGAFTFDNFLLVFKCINESIPQSMAGCVPAWRLVRRGCVRHNNYLGNYGGRGGRLLLGAYRKVATQNRMVPSLMTSRDPMTS